MNQYKGFAYSSQGYNHIKSGKECQDSSGFYSDESISIIVVADGHGSDNYPRTAKGSKFAVNVTIESIKAFIDTLKTSGQNFDIEGRDTQLEELCKNILMNWHQRIEDDIAANPFTENDLEKVSERYKEKYQKEGAFPKAYGTTLIAFCIAEDYCFGIHIGDGKCVAIDEDGNCSEPIPWDEECQANITTSLCDSDAIEEFRFYKSKTKPLAVFLGCDGIDDSYVDDNQLYDFYRSILFIFAENGFETGMKEVEDYLPKLSKKGSGDDVSISGLISSGITADTAAHIKNLIEYNKAKNDLEIAEKDLSVAREKMQYVSDAIAKSKKDLAELEKKMAKAQSDYEKKAAEYSKAEKDFSLAENAMNGLTTEKNDAMVLDATEIVY